MTARRNCKLSWMLSCKTHCSSMASYQADSRSKELSNVHPACCRQQWYQSVWCYTNACSLLWQNTTLLSNSYYFAQKLTAEMILKNFLLQLSLSHSTYIPQYYSQIQTALTSLPHKINERFFHSGTHKQRSAPCILAVWNLFLITWVGYVMFFNRVHISEQAEECKSC